MNLKKVWPEAFEAQLALTTTVKPRSITASQAELIKIRASQINGCLFCLEMHMQKALQLKETPQRLYGLAAWKEAPFFTAAEKAMLELAENITLASTQLDERSYEKAAQYLSEAEITDVLMTAVIINGWNRIMKSSGLLP